ncbi:MAG: magnesium transporter CorA family protein [Chlamydiales bacterium]|nr:magnesium transporter CorA family protein [Chlamydiales bacterium]
MLEIYCKTGQGGDFQQIDAFHPGCWIYVKEAMIDDLEKIVEITGLDLADIRDSLDKYELPRIEHIGDNLILFVRHPDEQEPGLYTTTLTIILKDHSMIAIAPHRSHLIEQFLAKRTEFDMRQTTKAILQILLKITQDYTTGIKKVRHSIAEPKHEHLVDSNVIILLMQNEEVLNQYLTSIVPMRNLLETMAAGRYVNLHEQDMDLLDDLMIALKQSEDVCRVNIKSIRSLRDSYQIMFTNNVNRTIKLLTALTVIVTIPTIIASIYGMNVSLPFQHTPYAFLMILVVTVLGTATAIYLFLRKRWL